jgi:RNase H-like domain found in reverse transcriptase/Reverse transcriptase (RNA-dependent DNA polymerase)/Integrase zinc binding domain
LGSPESKQKNLNFLPYIETTNKKTGKKMNILIDTGANKNIIRPEIIPNKLFKSIDQIQIKNVLGTQTVNKKIVANFLGHDLPAQTFYELNFHNFFDGILGAESMAKMKSNLNFKDNTITLNGIKIQFQKYFPERKTFNHTVTLDTTINGDWFVPKFQELKNIFIQPGLYRAENFKTTCNILSHNQKPPKFLPKIGLKVNNFETLEPIPISDNSNLNFRTLEKIIRTDHLSEFEKQKLFETILKNKMVLLKPNEKLSATTEEKHKIITTDEKPIYSKSYRYPHHYKADVEQQIQEMLDNNIITNSNSPYSAPIWVVPKKKDASGKQKIRVVIDYRKLNEKTVEDRFPMPQIEEVLDNIGKSEYFTTLDLKSGFHQILMDEDSKKKTAFSTSQGHFEFNRMPFGLKNSPATFQRTINKVLHGITGKCCLVYLDDIIIMGNSLEKHLSNLELVFKRLAEFNLKIQLDKCEFLKKETEFLGHVVTKDGVKTNPEKIQKIINWPLPKNDKEIKQFLGLAGYYRRFIKDYAKITKPMTKYLRKETPIDFSDKEYRKSFQVLKEIISTDQILAYPDFSKPFILTTDASDVALGAVLSQIQDSLERPIAFASRTLNSTESRYSTYEKEALAIIWAIKKYKPYLFGNKFTLVTDHKPLTFIKSAEKNSKILRWRLELADYDFDVIYKEGKSNVVADALSRRPEENLAEINLNPIDDDNLDEGSNPQDELDTVHSADTSDDAYIHFSNRPINYYRNQLIFKISKLNTIITETIFPNYRRVIFSMENFTRDSITEYLKKFHDNKQSAIMAPEEIIAIIQESFKENFATNGHFVLVTNMVEDVTNEERQGAIVAKEHERAHRGISEVENQIRRSYFFPKLSKMIKNFINTCSICNVHKYERKPYNIKIAPRPITTKPFERVHFDIFIINKTNFLSIIDAFSKHLQMIHIKTKNLNDVKKALTKYFANFSVPNLLISDHETTFQSAQFREFLGNLGSRIEYASSSEANGQIEKTHSTIIEIYNTNKHKFPNLSTASMIRTAVALYNNSVHSTTKFTPNEIIFNQTNSTNPVAVSETASKLFGKVFENQTKSNKNMEKSNPIKEKPPDLKEDQKVLIKPNIRTKLQPRAVEKTAKDIKERTFKIDTGVKRNKNKIKRLKKKYN